MTSRAAEVADFWATVDARIDKRIELALRDFAQNYRPRGAVSVPLTVGSPGTPLVTGLWVNGAKIHFPVSIDELHIVADVATETTFDLWVQRPGQTVAEAASIVGGNYPDLAGLQEVVIQPVTNALAGPGPIWTSIQIEPGSLLYLYVLTTDGAPSLVTFNLGPRAQ